MPRWHSITMLWVFTQLLNTLSSTTQHNNTAKIKEKEKFVSNFIKIQLAPSSRVASPITLSLQRPFHFHCSYWHHFYPDQTNTITLTQ